MIGQWLNRMGSSSTSSSLLATLLKDYPPYEIPFPGPARLLTEEQAWQNLHYLLENRKQRIVHLKSLLAHWHIHLDKIVKQGDYQTLVEELYQWGGEYWKAVYKPKLATNEAWKSTTRRGDQVVYSMLMDVAILLGEIVVNRRPSYHWTIDVDPDNVNDEMPTVKRPVLQVARNDVIPSPITLDVEALVVDRYLKPDSTILRLRNIWLESINDAIKGLHEEFWYQGTDGTS